jgi:natural product precursor
VENKKKPSKLTLSKKSLQKLSERELQQVVGGAKKSAGVTKTCSCTDDCLIEPCWD